MKFSHARWVVFAETLAGERGGSSDLRSFVDLFFYFFSADEHSSNSSVTFEESMS